MSVEVRKAQPHEVPKLQFDWAGFAYGLAMSETLESISASFERATEAALAFGVAVGTLTRACETRRQKRNRLKRWARNVRRSAS